ncbi:MAG: 2-dehydropantoate 2-reductase N-terminal domain-containing protein [Microbacterium sp.]
MSRRYVVIGAGGVGAALAAGLAEAGIPVVLVSRGRTYDAIREHGLRFTHEGRTRVLDVPVEGSPEGVALRPDDVLLLAVKSQDAPAALSEWAQRPVAGGIAGTALPVVTLQNGLDAERVALRHFDTVVSGTTLIAAQHVVPGEVTVRNGPKLGQIILGAFPTAELAADAAALVPGVADDLRRAQWLIHEAEDPRRWKAWKTLAASTFPVEVLAGTPEELDELRGRVRDEARRVFAAAGYGFADPSELSYDPAQARLPQAQDGPLGLSTWQSFARGSGSETDYLTGEIVLQARLLGIPAPASAAVRRTLAEAAAAGEKPGVRPARDILRALPDAVGAPA